MWTIIIEAESVLNQIAAFPLWAILGTLSLGPNPGTWPDPPFSIKSHLYIDLMR
jgi:hypothetical protein